jgi:hypothetical protein
MRRYYFAYLRYLLYVVLFSVAFAVVALLVLGLAHASINRAPASILRDGVAGPEVIVAAVTGIVAYVIYILSVSTIYQVVVKMRLWQAAVESVMISGVAALDPVQAGEATAFCCGRRPRGRAR